MLFVLAGCSYLFSSAQTEQADTTGAEVLQELVVKGYEQNRRLTEVASPVSIITQQQIQRYGAGSILPAVNAAPGVRMEERSPGSYRLNIRGSSLRSPFGIRNVKVYWNNIPFTDPGGNTYLNQFSLYNFTGIEILKGPAGSLYGAGTGGVMLINSFPGTSNNQVAVNYQRGSYQSESINISALAGNEAFRSMINYTHQTSDGYRDQSAMRRDIVSWETKFKNGDKQSISTHVFFGDLFYETPGALTKAQYLLNPKSARPPAPAAGLPGAVQNKAAIYQKTFWAGMYHEYAFSEQWQNSTAVYGAFSQVRNPAIRNYERRLEPNFGGRTTFTYATSLRNTRLTLVTGAEFQQGYADVKVYRNKAGNPDSLQTDDEINNRQGGIFTQAELIFTKGWIATAGLSLNAAAVNIDRLSVVPSFGYKTQYNNELAPRLSLLKKINNRVSVYGVLSKGFSPPTVAELLPSTSIINTELQAEEGINYELGVRAGLPDNRLSLDVNAFYFRLHNAITQRRDASGADYFLNAGDAKQQGLETALNYKLVKSFGKMITSSSIWVNHTYHHFRYRDFKQLNTDLSGKKIPGIAPHTLSAGIDIFTRPGAYATLHYFYSDPIPLNDANAEFAPAYRLLGFKAGFKKNIGEHISADLFISGDNMLNQTYSLGNDINAAGNRFYNAAPGVNYQAGIAVQYVFK